ncbi:MAG: hypothetical protein KKD48_00375 [Nanoarchaeota archaeon]|nr:hypothetical protein [Nanoarchaeota archaeon]
MAQSEIYTFLKNNKGKSFDAIQLATTVGIGIISARHNLMKLRHHNEIRCKFDNNTYYYWVE